MLQQADCQLQGRGGIPAEALSALQSDNVPPRHAVEARVYCENALRDYQPSPGVLQSVRWEHDPRQHRVDGWVSTGTAVTPSYDPLLAKVIGFGKTRDDARNALSSLLERSDVYGPTNVDFLIAVLASDAFASGRTLTSFLQKDFRFQPAVLEVLEHGLSTSVQDLPGRPEIGHGLPVSGPMDPLSFRLANAIVGNDDTRTEALEITLQGPSLRFHTAAVVALTGAAMELWLDDVPQAMFTKILVPPQSVLRVGNLRGDGGYRTYLAIRHGLPHVPRYLGSKSTCASLGLGGHQGRDLRTGDVLRLAPLQGGGDEATFTLPQLLRPPLVSADTSRPTTVYCMRGPYDDDEYLTPAGRASIYQRPMTVSHNVARSGIRFTPDGEMQWARQDGGQGGSHPSNILEFPYSVGGLNWNGDTPVALGVDGPDLGGLLISSTTVSAEYRLGQLSPGLKIQWTPITFEGARELSRRQDAYIAQVLSAARADQSDIEPLSMHLSDQRDVSPILHQTAPGDSVMTLRAAGDCCLLVELGEMRADIIVRAKVELMRRTLEKQPMAGVLYVDVNIRTLSIRFDPGLIQQRQLVERVVEVGVQLPSSLEAMEKLPCRTWHLPLCFGHPALGAAVDRYKATVRNKAVYLDQSAPGSDNRAYLAQCNGLDERVMEESLLTCPLWTVGIGFFLGTPILLSQDRRTRLRCQKYNPTRLSTPEGAFGWGGSMGAIYGVESPGGYQLVARTLPLWSTYGTAPGFKPDQPWLLSSFDSIQFHKVTVDEYDRSLASLKAGTWKWEVEDKLFDVVEQAQFEASIAEAANQYEAKQSEAIARSEKQERQMYMDWQHDQKQQQQQQRQQQQSSSGSDTTAWDWERDPKAIKIKAAMNASVWKVVARVDEQIKEGGPVVILEAMKTEIPCKADSDMVVKRVIVEPGSLVSTGDVVAVGLPL